MMPPKPSTENLHKHIISIMGETGSYDPYDAVRIKAREVVSQYYQSFGEIPPFNVKAVSSLRGLHWSDDDPRFSSDSEIAPEADGRVVLRVNKNRPLTRQRFSICHEIAHTLFPEYHLQVQCRKRNDESFADPNDLLETLCDVAASELMFPLPWFKERLTHMAITASDLALLADDYQASREATVRRFVELHTEPLAAVFFSWKLKPTEERKLRRRENENLLFPECEEPPPPLKLRVDYRITNKEFDRQISDYIPEDKSIPHEGAIFEASTTQTLQDGKQVIDFGRLCTQFNICALPIFTLAEEVGPNSGCSVVAVLKPIG